MKFSCNLTAKIEQLITFDTSVCSSCVLVDYIDAPSKKGSLNFIVHSSFADYVV